MNVSYGTLPYVVITYHLVTNNSFAKCDAISALDGPLPLGRGQSSFHHPGNWETKCSPIFYQVPTSNHTYISTTSHEHDHHHPWQFPAVAKPPCWTSVTEQISLIVADTSWHYSRPMGIHAQRQDSIISTALFFEGISMFRSQDQISGCQVVSCLYFLVCL